MLLTYPAASCGECARNALSFRRRAHLSMGLHGISRNGCVPQEIRRLCFPPSLSTLPS